MFNLQQAIAIENPKTTRKMRNPTHDSYVSFRPYQLQPFMIAPVLPGETLKNLNITGRVITDPLATGPLNILPWWHEMYFFYVKLRDLDARADFEAMLMDGTTITSLNSAAQDETYHQGGAPNFVQMCLKRVTEEYFRNEGETWNGKMLGNLPLVSAVQQGKNWADSLLADTAVVPSNNDLQNPEGIREPTPAMLEAYERMRAMRMIDMSFNEWLATYGVNVPGEGDERDKPELIRYCRNWSYPTNVVEPTTGIPSAAVAWSTSERADKDRFFREPGFIFGVQTVRAKLYMGNQRGSASTMLGDAYAWLSALFRDRPEAAIKEFAGGGAGTATGPLRGQTNGYWVDIRDLFHYGDQYIAGGGTLPQPFAPALPDATGDRRWLTSAQIDALFNGPTVNKIRADHVTNLSILGHPTTAIDNT